MSAYVIMLREHVNDAAAMEHYAELAAAAREGHDVTPLARYGELQMLEGEPVEGAVLLRFPSMREALAWYQSDAYQNALQHRLRGASYRVLIAEGVDASPSEI